jgi:hypothetical protein
MRYGWIITEDHINTEDGDVSDVNRKGPRDLDKEVFERLQAGEGSRFRLYDDDNNLYYEGRFLGIDEFSGFEPLDDFGMPWAGCTIIRYLIDDEWVTF